jgi:hypothetical protein
MLQPLDGPSLQGSLSVTTGTVVELKVGTNPYSERKVITVQPNGKIYVFFGEDNTIPTVSDIQTKGFTHFKDAMQTYEATCTQRMYVLSVAGTVSVKLAERA